MSQGTRVCLDCLADISRRHGNAKRCERCAKLENQRIQRDRETYRAPRYTRPHCRSELVQKDCVVCRTPFKTRYIRAVTCSLACREWNRNHPGMPRPVSVCQTCGKPFESTRCSAKWCGPDCRPSRGRTARTLRYRIAICGHCSVEFVTSRYNVKFCSKRCEYTERNAPGSFNQRLLRNCEYCGSPIANNDKLTKRHCSDQCTVLANQLVRRARRLGLPVERIRRIAVFERDRWTCHICHELVDSRLISGPYSASLDHIIPYSVVGCPGHVWSNVALAHLRCNISKNGRVRLEDWQLHRELLKVSL